MKYLAITVPLVLVILGAAFYHPQAEGGEQGTIVLSERNTVSLNTPIFGDSARMVQEELLFKSNNLRRGEPIYLVLNSPGGSIDDGFAIIEMAKGLGRPVHTISMFSASMSFIISQYLGHRYVLQSSTLMSHRAAAGGLAGTIPGSLLRRVMILERSLANISIHVSERAGVKLPDYLNATANELWLTADDAVRWGFADNIIKVRCDKTLIGPGKEQVINLGFFSAHLRFDKCPLITQPIVAQGDEEFVKALVNDKATFIHKYMGY